MKTYQIFRTISEEYFIEAESENEAFEYIDNGSIEPEETTELSRETTDIWTDGKWESQQ